MKITNWYGMALVTIIVAMADSSVAGCRGEAQRASVTAEKIRYEWPLRFGDQVTEYIQKLGDELAQRAAVNSDNSQWHFLVVRDHSANAFAIGGGHIYVTDGTLAFAENESEFAAILAHEIGHQLSGHFCEPQSQKAVSSDWWDPLGWFSNPYQGQEKAVRKEIGSVVQIIDSSKELEADKLAISILYSSDFNPHSMLNVVTRLPKKNSLAHLRDQRRIGALTFLLENKHPIVVRNSSEFLQVKSMVFAE